MVGNMLGCILQAMKGYFPKNAISMICPIYILVFSFISYLNLVKQSFPHPHEAGMYTNGRY